MTDAIFGTIEVSPERMPGDEADEDYSVDVEIDIESVVHLDPVARAIEKLTPNHLADLRGSGLSDRQIHECRFKSSSNQDNIKKVLKRTWDTHDFGSCLCIPYFNPDGTLIPLDEFVRLKPSNPPPDKKKKNGKAAKYLSPCGCSPRLYFPPATCKKLQDAGVDILFTEGEKKAAKADQEGFCCVGLGGVNSFSDGNDGEVRKLIPDFDAINLYWRKCYVVFDSDLADNPHVLNAEWEFAQALQKRGANVKVVRLPNGPVDASGKPSKVGLDDYLITHSVEDFRKLLEQALPPIDPKANKSRPQPVRILSPGTRVLCDDMGNIGDVVSDDGGDTVEVHFVSPEGVQYTTDIQRKLLRYADDGRSVIPTTFTLDLISSKDFANANYKLRYLIKHVLVEGQPCIVGGPRKGLKTGTMIDLAISLGTATPFLGRKEFAVPERVNTMILSGESGLYTLQETAKRIALAHEVDLADASIWWCEKLPSISNPDHLDVLREVITANKIKVTIIDPAYLCLLSGDTKGRQASNLFDVGALLLGLAEVGRDTGCGIILAHHTRKNPAEPFAVPELEELAYAGFAEFARQWILMNRRSPYKGGGSHQLWLAIGGSAGHSSTWAYNVEEGVPDEWFRGRYWDATIVPAAEAIEAAKEARERQKLNDAHSKQAKAIERITEFLSKQSEPLTANDIRDSCGFNGKTFQQPWAEFLSKAKLKTDKIKKGNNQWYTTFFLELGH